MLELALESMPSMERIGYNVGLLELAKIIV